MTLYFSALLHCVFQVYNLSQNIQEDDLQHLQVSIVPSFVVCLFILFEIIVFVYSSLQNMAVLQWKRSTRNHFRYWSYYRIHFTKTELT